MIDSASTYILPLFGIDELNCSLEQFWNVSSTKNIVWQYYHLVNRPLTKTSLTNEWQNDRMQSTSASGLVALMQDQEEGMLKYQIWKQLMQVITTLSYLIIITYSRFKKDGPVIFCKMMISI